MLSSVKADKISYTQKINLTKVFDYDKFILSKRMASGRSFDRVKDPTYVKQKGSFLKSEKGTSKWGSIFKWVTAAAAGKQAKAVRSNAKSMIIASNEAKSGFGK